MKTYRAWGCTDGTVDVVEHCESCGGASIISCNLPAEIAEKEVTERNAWETNSPSARLISAAPDMLAALQECITDDGANCLAYGTDTPKIRRRLAEINAIAREAISKATGE